MKFFIVYNQYLLKILHFVQDDNFLVMPAFFVMPGLTGHLFLLQRLGRIGAHQTDGLETDGGYDYSNDDCD